MVPSSAISSVFGQCTWEIDGDVCDQFARALRRALARLVRRPQDLRPVLVVEVAGREEDSLRRRQVAQVEVESLGRVVGVRKDVAVGVAVEVVVGEDDDGAQAERTAARCRRRRRGDEQLTAGRKTDLAGVRHVGEIVCAEAGRQTQPGQVGGREAARDDRDRVTRPEDHQNPGSSQKDPANDPSFSPTFTSTVASASGDALPPPVAEPEEGGKPRPGKEEDAGVSARRCTA